MCLKEGEIQHMCFLCPAPSSIVINVQEASLQILLHSVEMGTDSESAWGFCLGQIPVKCALISPSVFLHSTTLHCIVSASVTQTVPESNNALTT